MQILGVSLTFTWPLRLCLFRVLLCEPLLQAFPFPSTLEEVTLHQLSQACVFIYSSHEKWVFPPLLWSFPHPATFTNFLTPGCRVCAAAPAFSGLACLFTAHVGSGPCPFSCGVFLPPPLLQAFPLLVAGRVPPLLPSLAWLVYLQFCEGFSSPAFSAQGTPPSLLYVFIVVIAYYSVSLFFPGWGSVCPGGYADLAQGCLWEYCIPLSSPCGLRLPKPSGHWCLAVAQGPS
jgi:hypothetical protein